MNWYIKIQCDSLALYRTDVHPQWLPRMLIGTSVPNIVLPVDNIYLCCVVQKNKFRFSLALFCILLKNTNAMTHIIMCVSFLATSSSDHIRTVIFDHVRNALLPDCQKKKRGLTIRDIEIRIHELFLYFMYFYTDAIRRCVFQLSSYVQCYITVSNCCAY